jgi:hypothetical protein
MRFSGSSYVGSVYRDLCFGAMLGWLSLPAHALDLTPDESRILTDPAFIPEAGQIVGATSLVYGSGIGNVGDLSGTRLYSLDTRTLQISQSVSYGITRKVSIWGDISRASPTTHYDFASGAHANRGDPETYLQLGITDRVLDQASLPFNLDVTLAVPGRLTLALSRELTAFTIAGSAGVYRAGSDHEFDPVRDADVHVNRFWGYFFAVQTQTRLTSTLSINLAAKYISANVDDAHASIGGSSFLIDYPNQVKFDLALNYQLIANRLVAQLSGTYSVSSTRRDVYPDPAFNLVTKGRELRAGGFSLIYSF